MACAGSYFVSKPAGLRTPARNSQNVRTRLYAERNPQRREIHLVLVGLAALWSGPALAVDVKAAQKAKEARKQALKAAAEQMRETGVGKNAFSRSEFSVSEDKSSNIHSRQEEGKRTQVNA